MSTDRQAIINEALSRHADAIRPGTERQLATLLASELANSHEGDLPILIGAKLGSAEYSHFKAEAQPAPTPSPTPTSAPPVTTQMSLAEARAAAQAEAQARFSASLVANATKRNVGSDGHEAVGLTGNYGRRPGA